jgi:tetratricopeptide (TPR) repeat protein
MRRRPGIARVFACVGIACALAGCGDRVLWERWCAERDGFLAQRGAERVMAHAASATPAEWDRAARALEQVARAHPVQDWITRGAPAGAARQVAVAGQRAWLQWGRLEVARGRDSVAVRALTEVTAAAASMPGLAAEAFPLIVAAEDRQGHFDASLRALSAFAELDPVADAEHRVPPMAQFEAPIALARELRERGHAAEADAALARADARFAAAFTTAKGDAVTPVAQALSRIRVARGDGPGALAALRQAYERAPSGDHPARLLEMAQAALAARMPDSAMVFARAAGQLDASRRILGRSMLISAQAWSQIGVMDSALASYQALLVRWPDLGALGAPARYEHALLLDQAGRWEAARAELRSVAARYPGHPLAFAAVRQVVQHDLQHGKVELAQVTGGTELEKLARQLATDHDPEVQRQARALQGDLQLALGRTGAAESTYVDLWRMFPADSLAEASALQAAGLAAHRPGGAERSLRLYRQLSVNARSAAVREAAARGAGNASAPGGSEPR